MPGAGQWSAGCGSAPGGGSAALSRHAPSPPSQSEPVALVLLGHAPEALGHVRGAHLLFRGMAGEHRRGNNGGKKGAAGTERRRPVILGGVVQMVCHRPSEM